MVLYSDQAKADLVSIIEHRVKQPSLDTAAGHARILRRWVEIFDEMSPGWIEGRVPGTKECPFHYLGLLAVLHGQGDGDGIKVLRFLPGAAAMR